MNRKNIFGFVAILTILVGLLFLILPEQSMSMYGTTLDYTSTFITRYFGLWMVGIGIIFWMMRKADSIKEAIKACLVGGILIALLGLAISIWNTFEALNSFVWFNVALYAICLILLGYLYLKKAD
jgi:uncharacterized protein YjeT (DUF2065 family)